MPLQGIPGKETGVAEFALVESDGFKPDSRGNVRLKKKKREHEYSESTYLHQGPTCPILLMTAIIKNYLQISGSKR